MELAVTCAAVNSGLRPQVDPFGVSLWSQRKTDPESEMTHSGLSPREGGGRSGRTQSNVIGHYYFKIEVNSPTDSRWELRLSNPEN